jgi:hypothetical protein
MIEPELVNGPYAEGDKACLEVRFQGRVEKWSSAEKGHLTLEGFDAGNKFVHQSGNWYRVEATSEPVKPNSDIHLAQVYERLRPMLETVLANKGSKGEMV